MPTVHLIDTSGQRTALRAASGSTLMQAATDAGVAAIAADCGGLMTCATCHVYVAEAWQQRLPAPTAQEQAMLEMTAAERRPGSRLSCQIVLDASCEGLEVELPATQY